MTVKDDSGPVATGPLSSFEGKRYARTWRLEETTPVSKPAR